ncbi:MAG TPA: hypothetical protein VMX75_05670 [Spirochaetia bacterium]|nr:hypothetical protein [Spirochaetia bacterium]
MLRHRKLTEWEGKLKEIFDEIDDYVEDSYGRLYPLHPSRSKRGGTSNKEEDGLFNIGASYSAGFGSEHGAGYVIEVRVATLENVEESVRSRIENDIVRMLNQKLDKAFPGKKLKAEKDGPVYKIHGDISLGTV